MAGIFNKQTLNGSIFSGFGTVGSLGTPEEDCSSRAGALWDPAKGTCGPDPEAGLEDRCGYIGGQWSDQQICERLPETTVTPFLEGCNATGGGIVDNDFCDYALTATGRQAELAPTFDLNVQQSRPWWHYAIAGGLAFFVGKWIVRKLAKKRSFAANGRRRASEPPVWEDDFPPWAMEKERARHGQTKRLRAAGAVIRSRAAARRKMKAAAKAYFKEHGHLFKANSRVSHQHLSAVRRRTHAERVRQCKWNVADAKQALQNAIDMGDMRGAAKYLLQLKEWQKRLDYAEMKRGSTRSWKKSVRRGGPSYVDYYRPRRTTYAKWAEHFAPNGLPTTAAATAREIAAIRAAVQGPYSDGELDFKGHSLFAKRVELLKKHLAKLRAEEKARKRLKPNRTRSQKGRPGVHPRLATHRRLATPRRILKDSVSVYGDDLYYALLDAERAQRSALKHGHWEAYEDFKKQADTLRRLATSLRDRVTP